MVKILNEYYLCILILGVRQVVLNKGDVVIFHSNILHRSDKNESDKRRLALAIAYNTKRNNPTKKHHHPFYTKMEKVSISSSAFPMINVIDQRTLLIIISIMGECQIASQVRVGYFRYDGVIGLRNKRNIAEVSI